MSIKIILIFFFFFLSLIFSSQLVFAGTVANTFQVTSDGAQQKDAIVYKNLIAYTNFGGAQGSDIWGYDLDSQQNFPIVEKAGEQYLTGHFGKYIVYEDYDGSDYNLRLFNKSSGHDELVAGGVDAQVGGVTNGDEIAYINGGACGSIHLYNINKKADETVSPNGCGPLSISDKAIVWANGSPGGTNLYGYDLKKEVLFDVVTDNNFQESPNIFGDEVTYIEYATGALGDYYAIKMINLKNNEKITIYETTTSTLQGPALSDKYVVWSESTAQHVNGIQGAVLKTGEIFEVQAQGPHQNSHTDPSIWKNVASWMSFRTGNGDIYGSELTKSE